MRKRKIYSYLLVFTGLLMVSAIVEAYGSMPLNFNVWAVSLAVVLIDFYLWKPLSEKFTHIPKGFALLMTLMFWGPFAWFAGGLLYSLWHPFIDWPATLKTWYFGLLVLGYASKFVPALFLLLADLSGWIARLSGCRPSQAGHKPEEVRCMTRSKFLRNLGLLGGGVVFSGLLAGILKWVDDFRVRRVSVPIRGLPAAFEGFRIVQLSDLHLGSWPGEEALGEAVGIINRLEPDLIVFTGDLVNYSTDEALPFANVLRGLDAPHGVLAVMGNHDYGGYVKWPSPAARKTNLLKLQRFYRDIGWRLLNNEAWMVRRGDEKIAVLGVENWGGRSRFPKKGDIKKALGQAGDAAVQILLSHDPSHWDQVVRHEAKTIQLTLSGHTHGMQMGIETAGVRWSPAQYFYKFWAGLYATPDHRQYLYVNRGLGSIGYPGRIGILPEITLISLQRAGGEGKA